MKTTFRTIVLGLGLALSLLAAGPVLAQTPVAADALSDPTLKSMLDGMGLEPKALSKGFLLAIKSGTWTFNVQVVLSPDKTKLGMNANLGLVSNAGVVPAATWLTLLESNGDIDPSAFYFDKDQKKLYLHRSLDNIGLTPARLRTQIDSFVANIRDTSEIWKFAE